MAGFILAGNTRNRKRKLEHFLGGLDPPLLSIFVRFLFLTEEESWGHKSIFFIDADTYS